MSKKTRKDLFALRSTAARTYEMAQEARELMGHLPAAIGSASARVEQLRPLLNQAHADVLRQSKANLEKQAETQQMIESGQLAMDDFSNAMLRELRSNSRAIAQQTAQMKEMVKALKALNAGLPVMGDDGK